MIKLTPLQSHYLGISRAVYFGTHLKYSTILNRLMAIWDKATDKEKELLKGKHRHNMASLKESVKYEVAKATRKKTQKPGLCCKYKSNWVKEYWSDGVGCIQCKKCDEIIEIIDFDGEED